MKFTCRLHLHLGNILYKFGLNHSLDNTVMNLYLSACTAQVTHFFLREGWSNVLSIPSLYKLQRYQILPSIC